MTAPTLTRQDAVELRDRFSALVVKYANKHGGQVPEKDKTLGSVALQLMHDMVDGRIDLNTWAQGSGMDLIWQAIRTFDTLGIAESIEAEYEADPKGTRTRVAAATAERHRRQQAAALGLN